MKPQPQRVGNRPGGQGSCSSGTPGGSGSRSSAHLRWQKLLAEPDPELLLRQFASATRAALERQADLFEVVRQAAPSEPDVAELEQRASLGRWHDVRQLAQALADRDARLDVDVDTAADIIWALASPQLYRPLVAGRRWSGERWEAWLDGILTSQLLEPRRMGRRSGSRRTLPGR